MTPEKALITTMQGLSWGAVVACSTIVAGAVCVGLIKVFESKEMGK